MGTVYTSPLRTPSIMTSNSSTTVEASPRVHQLLQRLHSLSETQEKSFSQILFYVSRLVRFLMFREIWSPAAEEHMKDKFVALDADKCRFIYLLARKERLLIPHSLDTSSPSYPQD